MPRPCLYSHTHLCCLIVVCGNTDVTQQPERMQYPGMFAHKFISVHRCYTPLFLYAYLYISEYTHITHIPICTHTHVHRDHIHVCTQTIDTHIHTDHTIHICTYIHGQTDHTYSNLHIRYPLSHYTQIIHTHICTQTVHSHICNISQNS